MIILKHLRQRQFFFFIFFWNARIWSIEARNQQKALHDVFNVISKHFLTIWSLSGHEFHQALCRTIEESFFFSKYSFWLWNKVWNVFWYHRKKNFFTCLGIWTMKKWPRHFGNFNLGFWKKNVNVLPKYTFWLCRMENRMGAKNWKCFLCYVTCNVRITANVE